MGRGWLAPAIGVWSPNSGGTQSLATNGRRDDRDRARPPRAGWRTVAILVGVFAVLAAGAYGVVTLREQQVHHGPEDRLVVVNPHS